MRVTKITRELLAIKREKRKLEALGYRRHEADWELHRGFVRRTHIIVDAKISVCGKYVYTKIDKAGGNHETTSK